MSPFPFNPYFDNAGLIPAQPEASNEPSVVGGSLKDTRQLQVQMPEWAMHREHRNASLDTLGGASVAVTGRGNFGPAEVARIPGLPDNLLTGLSAAVDKTRPEPMLKMINTPHAWSALPSSEKQLPFDIHFSDALLPTGQNNFDPTEPSNQWMEASVSQDAILAQPSHNLRIMTCGATTPQKKQTKVVSTQRCATGVRKGSLGQASSRTTYNKRRRQLTPYERKSAAVMRRLSPCVRCRMYKAKVIRLIQLQRTISACLHSDSAMRTTPVQRARI
jgi:hypothetical protein